MFKLAVAPTFAHTVHITVPGVAEPQPLALTLRVMGRKALALWVKRPGELAQQAAAAAGSADVSTAAAEQAEPQAPDLVTEASYLGEVIADWSDVQDSAGQPLPYSATALADLLDACPAAASEIFRGFLAGLTESRAKN